VIVFPTDNCQKTVIFPHSRENKAKFENLAEKKVWPPTFTSYVKMSANFNIKFLGGDSFSHFGLGLLVSLMFGGVYAYPVQKSFGTS
jgi:hypothetical protein